jgi:DNA-binding transcriptional ArsR family regulator
MFGFLKKEKKQTNKKTKAKTVQRAVQTKPLTSATTSPSIATSNMTSDTAYDIIRKLSDLQDQISRHDSRVHDKIDDHHNFMLNQHHEPMKKATIEIMNKLYTQPAPVRDEVMKLISTDEKILQTIGEGKMNADQVAKQIGVTREHVSRRISNLTKAGLLERKNEGRYVFYSKTDAEPPSE